VPDGRIVFAYDLFHDGRLISVSLTTVELEPHDGGTKLRFTEQGDEQLQARAQQALTPAASELAAGRGVIALGPVAKFLSASGS
jgi:hypothetical protein